FILGHYSSLLKDKIDENLIHLAKQYGGIFRLHTLFNKPQLVITDPKLVQTILNSYDCQGVMARTLNSDFFGSGLIRAQGKDHKRQRKLMNPLFTFTNIKEMVPIFVQGGRRLKDCWTKQILDKKEEKISITSLIHKITLDIIGFVGFNYDFNSITSGSELAQAYYVIGTYTTSPLYNALIDLFPFIRKFPFSFNVRYNNSLKIIRTISENLVIEHKKNPIRGKDLLSLLIEANEIAPDNERLTHDEPICQIKTLLITGHETTSISLSWALYFLAKNPKCQDQLREELINAFPDSDHHPNFDEIEKLKYLDCVFKETLRVIPPGNNLTNSVSTIHHNPLIWGENVHEFDPSRWFDPELKAKITNFMFLPFGAGNKSCIGSKLAQLEFKTLICILIRNFKFKLVEGFVFKKKPIGLPRPIPGIDLLISKLDE
ncbi:25450_t:CDS:2, partial [Racocetra persica]